MIRRPVSLSRASLAMSEMTSSPFAVSATQRERGRSQPSNRQSGPRPKPNRTAFAGLERRCNGSLDAPHVSAAFQRLLDWICSAGGPYLQLRIQVQCAGRLDGVGGDRPVRYDKVVDFPASEPLFVDQD